MRRVVADLASELLTSPHPEERSVSKDEVSLDLPISPHPEERSVSKDEVSLDLPISPPNC